MKTILITIILCLGSLMLCGQTQKQLQSKSDKIYTYYKHHQSAVPKNCINYKLAAADSLIRMLPSDTWFTTLSPVNRKFRILRIKKYEAICIKHPKNLKYMQGWSNLGIQP